MHRQKNIRHYFTHGDVVNTDLIDYIRGRMQLEMDKPDYVQVDEIQDYCYDGVRALGAIFPSFAECSGQWRYYGACYKWESVNMG